MHYFNKPTDADKNTSQYLGITEEEYVPSQKDDRFRKYWKRFEHYKQDKEQNIRFFNKNGIQRNIYNYISDSVDSMNEFHIKPNWKEDWQNNTFDPVTRNKLITVLSMLVQSRMKIEVLVKRNSIFKNPQTKARQLIYSSLLDNANNHNDEDYALIWELYTTMVEGTMFGYEGWTRDTREVEYIKEFNPETGEKITKKIKYDDWDDVFGEIVPIEEIFPETIWVNAKDWRRKVQRCYRVREVTLQEAKDRYAQFVPEGEDIKPAGEHFDQSGFEWGISQNVDKNNVQIVEYYDAKEDIFGLWANGLELYFGPLPFNHKQIPFWVAINELIHHQFLFGKSMPDKMLSDQNVNNSVLNGMLDQLIIGLNSPIFVDGLMDEEDLTDGYLELGKIIKLDPGGKVQPSNLGHIDPSAFQLLDKLKRSMEETTVSAQASGVPTGGRKTKFEVQQLQEGALNLASQSLQLMEHAMKNKYRLRLANILQYYSFPSRVKTGKRKFKFLTVENTKLSNGKTGKKLIQILDDSEKSPSKEDLTQVAQEEEGKEFDPRTSQVEPLVVRKKMLMTDELELDIIIIANSSVKDSKTTRQNKDIAFYQSTVGNPLFDQVETAKDFARAFDKSEDIVNEKPETGGMQGEQGGLPGLPGMKGQSSNSINPEDLL